MKKKTSAAFGSWVFGVSIRKVAEGKLFARLLSKPFSNDKIVHPTRAPSCHFNEARCTRRCDSQKPIARVARTAGRPLAGMTSWLPHGDFQT